MYAIKAKNNGGKMKYLIMLFLLLMGTVSDGALASEESFQSRGRAWDNLPDSKRIARKEAIGNAKNVCQGETEPTSSWFTFKEKRMVWKQPCSFCDIELVHKGFNDVAAADFVCL